MKTNATPGMTARYKVEHCNASNVWVPLHRGKLRSYSSALKKKQAFCRILVDYLGNGVWEEIESLPSSASACEAWDVEKRAILLTFEQGKSVANVVPVTA